MPLISICIPAYKNADYLQRLLDSISIQTYKDFEVIITDDSPDATLELLVHEYKFSFKILYIKNEIALGTPANWNFAISKAKGEWIKLMHNDDWFADETSLEIFAQAILNSDNVNFIFSGFKEVNNNDDKEEHVISNLERALLKKSPLNLFKKNFIGHPSTTLIKNNRKVWYDEKIKWVVDFEFYIRCLEHKRFFSINQSLINIGIHENQVTKVVFRKPEIEIPENLYLINKLGDKILKNIFVYDYYWRLFRNLKMRNFNQVNAYSKNNMLPEGIKKMLMFQFKIPLVVLTKGIFSKCFMLISKMLA
jgi:glycosyltransferase involved in cell wall biosynthesis